MKLTSLKLKKYPNYPVYKAGFFEMNPGWNTSYVLLFIVTISILIKELFNLSNSNDIMNPIFGVLLFAPLIVMMFAIKKVNRARCPTCRDMVLQFEYKSGREEQSWSPFYSNRCYLCHHCKIGIKNAIGQNDEKEGGYAADD